MNTLQNLENKMSKIYDKAKETTWYTLIFDNGYQIWTIDNSKENIERNERIFKGKIIEVISF